MIVSPSLRLIFVHVPKTAGSTIEALIEPWLDPTQDLHLSKAASIRQNFAAAGVAKAAGLTKHATAPAIRASMGADLYRNHFSFAFSRSPFSRCFSAYRFLQKRADKTPGDPEGHDTAALRARLAGLTFDDACGNLEFVARFFSLFRPQTRWLPSKGAVNYVGRVEHLAQDMAQVFALVELPASGLATIPQVNVKTARDEWRSMSGACVDAIRIFYATDFERFGYSTDPQADAPALARLPVRGKGAQNATPAKPLHPVGMPS